MPDNPRLSIDGRLRFRVAALAALLLFCGFDEPSVAAEVDAARVAQVYGRQHGSVQAQSDGLIIAEAEEFRLQRPGWNAINWGDNYSTRRLELLF